MIIKVLFEDGDIIVVEKPAGIESQSARTLEPDMVSEVKKHINKLSPEVGEPYVGVIHRLDKPVSGVMVYAKTKEAAAALSKQVKDRQMKKMYYAVVCGQPVENSGIYVDYLWRDGKTNTSKIVDKETEDGKRGELSYRVVDKKQVGKQLLCLVEIELLTGRHHQIRVQFAGHGTPLWGDRKYNPMFQEGKIFGNVALCASELTFIHPKTGKRMMYEMKPQGGAFARFF